MGFLRRGDDADGTRYRMREKLFAIGDDFWIETESGERAFKVNGKALRIRDTFVLEDASGDTEQVSARELNILLKRCGARLVVLNACQSATLRVEVVAHVGTMACISECVKLF